MAVKPSKSDLANAMAQAVRYRQMGNLKAAKAAYADILKKDADNAEVLHLQGCLLEEMGNPDQAIKLLAKAAKADPVAHAYRYNLANMLFRQGNLVDAVRYYREAIALKPDYAVAHNNLGRALIQIGDVATAKACFLSAIAQNAHYADPHNSLSLVLKAQGDLDGALASSQAAVAIKPDFAEAHCNMGGAYLLMQRIVDAAHAYQTAVKLQPALAMHHANLGGALLRLGKQEDAVAEFEVALRLDPSAASTRSNRILASSYVSTSAQDLWLQAQAWGRMHSMPTQRPMVSHKNLPEPERRLRVGYVSADFRNHAAAYWIEPLLSGLHHDHFEVICYNNSARVDAVTERLKPLADTWVECFNMNDVALADRIRADGIDILVDLSSHTEGNRLLVFALQPAPVQVSWFGFPVSTGLPSMHYRITDAVMDPPGHSEVFYSEQLVRVNRFYAAFRPDPACGAVGLGPVERNGFVTFASFNTFSKITPAMLSVWAQLLVKLPGSRLLLQAAGMEHADLARDVQSAFGAWGVEPARLTLRGWTGIEDYLRLGHEADIALDPFPFNGGVTTCHALWMGLPVITLVGETAPSRVGASILTRLELGDCVAKDSEAYLQTAIAWAQDRAKLAATRTSMRDRMATSGLLDGAALATEVEQAFRTMWHTWCATRR